MWVSSIQCTNVLLNNGKVLSAKTLVSINLPCTKNTLLSKCEQIHRYLWICSYFRSSRRRCFMLKIAFRNFTKFTGKHPCQSLFFNKVAGLISKMRKIDLRNFQTQTSLVSFQQFMHIFIGIYLILSINVGNVQEISCFLSTVMKNLERTIKSTRNQIKIFNALLPLFYVIPNQVTSHKNSEKEVFFLEKKGKSILNILM